MGWNKWHWITDISILRDRQEGYTPLLRKIWWGGINVDNCKSPNNKNCLMAMYRAAKKKKHFIHIWSSYRRRQLIINNGRR